MFSSRPLWFSLTSKSNTLSFDSASVAVKNEQTGAVERVDLPMRACAGGYYDNLIRMYDYIGIPLHAIRFLFVFGKALSASQLRLDAYKPEDASDAPASYFVHASNLHQTPPPRPSSRGFLAHYVEVLYLIVCHFWFSVVCFFVPPMADSAIKPGVGESFEQYLGRIWLPRRYISHYLVPLMSSVSTCSHSQLLAFPASDIVAYKKLSQGQQHYAVCGGVHQVQTRLVQGVGDVRLDSRVLSVSAEGDGIQVSWRSASRWDGELAHESFDRVVLSVSPDVAARLYRPLSDELERIPTTSVESSVLSSHLGKYSISHGSDRLTKRCAHHDADKAPVQVITFRTRFDSCGSQTEALHTMPGGMVVSTCPLEPERDAKEVLETAKFTRTLRTPESRSVVQRITGASATSRYDGWVNGKQNVWIVGAWCWDGMVLLEGCVVSAMRVAHDFGVEIPW